MTNPKNAHSVLRFNFGKSDLNCVVEEKHTHMQVIVYLRFSLVLKSSKYLFNLKVKSHDGVRVQFFGSAAVKSGKCPTELRKGPEGLWPGGIQYGLSGPSLWPISRSMTYPTRRKIYTTLSIDLSIYLSYSQSTVNPRSVC